MKKLFLSSSFKDVAPWLVHFVGENLEGKKSPSSQPQVFQRKLSFMWNQEKSIREFRISRG